MFTKDNDWPAMSDEDVDEIINDLIAESSRLPSAGGEKMSYAKEIKIPANIQRGTANHVQMIINRIEGGEPQEALYLAVDLLDELVSGHLVVRLRTEPRPKLSGRLGGHGW